MDDIDVTNVNGPLTVNTGHGDHNISIAVTDPDITGGSVNIKTEGGSEGGSGDEIRVMGAKGDVSVSGGCLLRLYNFFPESFPNFLVWFWCPLV